MSLWEKVFAACMIVTGFAVVWCTVASLVADCRERRRERTTPPPRFVGRAVVASDDPVFQASLNRMHQELDALLAYGEER